MDDDTNEHIHEFCHGCCCHGACACGEPDPNYDPATCCVPDA